tara:strand:- start:1319 stop:1543 length:225 start_codon:yes stop_codon:yes gene_type:complete
MKKENWEIEREKEDKKRLNAMSSLTEEQIKTIDVTYEAISDFINDYSEIFDVSSETARKLQLAFWSMRNEFKKD